MLVLVLISGSSGSGKSTIAKRVAEFITDATKQTVQIFHQDDYFTADFLPYHKRNNFLFENGFGIDWDKLVSDVEHVSTSDHDSNKECVIVVEGHMIGAAASKFFDVFVGQAKFILIFLDCPREICRARRLNRRKRTKEEYEELSNYIDTYVWPCFVQVGIPAMESMKQLVKTKRQQDKDACITMLHLSTKDPKAMEANRHKITQALMRLQHGNSLSRQQEEVTEKWPSLSGDLNGFAQHEVLTIHLDQDTTSSFELECVSSLSLLDMVNLSHGKHDATGHTVWMGPFLLIEALAADVSFAYPTNHKITLRSLFHSKSVLELGCGTGIGGLALLHSPDSWRSRPSHVAFSDNDSEVLNLCHQNCQRCWSSKGSSTASFEPSFATLLLTWGDSPFPQRSSCEDAMYEIVLATDVLYNLAFLRPLLSTFLQSTGRGSFFVLSHVPRSCLPDTEAASSELNGGRCYHTILEEFITSTASALGLHTAAIIRPGHIRTAQSQYKKSTNSVSKPLNSTSLEEMEEAGAAIFVFYKL